MQVKAVPGPIVQQAPNESEKVSRAVAAFNKASQPQQQEQPVQNATQVQPEELSAIQPSSENMEATSSDLEQPKEEKKEDPALSRQFAQLARQEKALRAKVQQQEAQYKQREAELAAREAKLNQQPQFDANQYYTRDQIKQNALEILQNSGVSYDELTQQAINYQPMDPRVQKTISDLQQQIQDLKIANDDSKKTYAEQQSNQYQAAVKQIENDAIKLVKSDMITYEAIHKTGTVKEVVKLIEETYKKDGILMTVEEAAQQVEDYLVEENYKMANKIDKIKRKMLEASTPKALSTPAKTSAEQGQKQPQPMKTLTNATSSTRQLSAKERALLAFEGKLRS